MDANWSRHRPAGRKMEGNADTPTPWVAKGNGTQQQRRGQSSYNAKECKVYACPVMSAGETTHGIRALDDHLKIQPVSTSHHQSPPVPTRHQQFAPVGSKMTLHPSQHNATSTQQALNQVSATGVGRHKQFTDATCTASVCRHI